MLFSRLQGWFRTRRDSTFHITFDSRLSDNQVHGTLAALAKYYRACGGVGFRVDFKREKVKSKPVEPAAEEPVKPFAQGMSLQPGESAAFVWPPEMQAALADFSRAGRVVTYDEGPITYPGPHRYAREIHVLVDGKPYAALTLNWSDKEYK